MKIAIFPNPDKPGALESSGRIVEFLAARGVGVVVSPEMRTLLQSGEAREPVEWGQVADFCIVLGGDGTLLSAIRATGSAELPLLGVNLGHLGFLTEVEAPDLFGILPQILDGNYMVEQRAMLYAEVVRNESSVQTFDALNEVVVSKGPLARLVQLNIWVDKRYIDTFPGDGVIISTATGSTAYSLSAGGPIVSPDVECIVVTPICAHTLYSRPMVISEKSRVGISFAGSSADMLLTVDGQEGMRLLPQDLIQVARSGRKARLVRLLGWNFFDVLRRKMKEGQVRI
jgi:NAD+ kinase